MQSTENRLSRPLVVCLLAAVSCLLWGSAAPMIKIGYGLLHISESQPWTMILFAGCRFSLAGALVIAFSSLTVRRWIVPKRESWPNVVKLGLVQTVAQYIFFYVGVANSSGVHSAILTGASSLWAILLACFLFRQERMTTAKVLGCMLGFGGILLMNLTGEGGGVTLMGEGFLLISGLCGGMASGQAKRYSRTESPVVLTGWQFLLGGLLMCVCGLLGGGRLRVDSAAAVGVLGYLGMLSAVAYSLWTVLLKHNAVSAVSIYGFMTPLFGVGLSAVMLGETSQAFSVNTLVALAMVCAGIVVVNRFGSASAESAKCHK